MKMGEETGRMGVKVDGEFRLAWGLGLDSKE